MYHPLNRRVDNNLEVRKRIDPLLMEPAGNPTEHYGNHARKSSLITNH